MMNRTKTVVTTLCGELTIRCMCLQQNSATEMSRNDKLQSTCSNMVATYPGTHWQETGDHVQNSHECNCQTHKLLIYSYNVSLDEAEIDSCSLVTPIIV